MRTNAACAQDNKSHVCGTNTDAQEFGADGLFSVCAARTNTHLWFQVSTQNLLVFELSVPLKASTACGPDRWENMPHSYTHTHTHTRCDEYTAGAGDLTKLNFPLLPFPIFHLPQRRRTCGEKWCPPYRCHASLSSLSLWASTVHSLYWSLQSVISFQRSLLIPSFPSALSTFATAPPLPPSLCRFCGSAPLTKSQRETSAGVPAKFLCLSAQITWDSPNYHAANQSISWVSAGDACPPLLWL